MIPYETAWSEWLSELANDLLLVDFRSSVAMVHSSERCIGCRYHLRRIALIVSALAVLQSGSYLRGLGFREYLV